ncbi:MAG TPA: type II secretion system F family protein [Anaeromyxobacteraceae bacterium]|nr:type II secretion system F family protein [Anaeromyxobacteraceae bacterium]
MKQETTSSACARCGRPKQPEAVECPYCGVIFAKLHPAPRAAGVRLARSAPHRAGYVPPSTLARLCVQIAQTLEAGSTLRALVATPVLSVLPRGVAERFRAEVLADAPPSQVLAGQGLLDAGLAAIVRASELQGELPTGLRWVGGELARRAKLRTTLLLALAYPLFLVLAAAVLLPLRVAFTSGWGAYLRRVAPIFSGVGVLCFLVVYLSPRVSRTSPLRRTLSGIARHLPLVGGASLCSALAAFAGVLGSSMRAGLKVREALALAAEGTSHPAFLGAGSRLVEKLDRGATLAEALRAVPAIPENFLSEVSAGELAGKLDEVLPALAEEHERRARLRWTFVAGALAAAVFALVTASVALEVVNGWTRVLREQGQEIDRLSR